MSTAKPLVSIFICTYNQEDFVEETLESFLNQKCNFDFEIVIAEDCSKDNTPAICKEYVSKYPEKIILIQREKNLGLIKNFFEGICHCRSKYIAMCGGDDYWPDETKLQKQFDFMESNPEYSICYTDSIMLDNDKNLLSDTEVGFENKKDFSREELIKGAFISARTMFFRNEIDFSKTNYHKIFNEDIFIISLIGQYGKGKFLSNIEPSVYRIHDKGIWSSLNEIQRLKAQMLTINSLSEYYKNKISEHSLYFKKRYYKINDKIFYLAIQEKCSAEVFNSYYQSLTNKNVFFSFTKMWRLNKTIAKYILFRK